MLRNTRVFPIWVGFLCLLVSFSAKADPIVGFSFFHELGLVHSENNVVVGSARDLYSHTIAMEVGYKPTRNLLVGVVAQLESYAQKDPEKGGERISLLSGKMMSFGPSVAWRNDSFFLQFQYVLLGSLSLSTPPKGLPGRQDAISEYSLAGMRSWKARGGFRIFGVLYLHGFVGYSRFTHETWKGSYKLPPNDVLVQDEETFRYASPLRWFNFGLGTTVVF